MDNHEPTAEEIAAEQAATQVPKEEEVRAKIIEEFGFDEEADKERIDKLVAKDIESRKKLSDAIGQKIKHRTEADALRKNPPKPKEGDTVVPPKPSDLSATDIIALAKADLPEDDINQLREYAAFKKISVAEAMKDPVMAQVLATNAEVRRTAQATNTKRSERGGAAPTGEDLLAAQESGTGKLLETDEEMRQLGMARWTRKVRKH